MLDLLIITGASKGIGKNIAINCFNICKNMMVISSSNEIDNIKSDCCNVLNIKTDLCDYKNTYEKVVFEISKLNNIQTIGIILCAAQLGNSGGLFSSNIETWDNQYKCNVLGNLSVVKACAKLIESGSKTRIAFFAGGGAAYGYPDFFGYSLSKVAVVRAAENLSLELSKINKDVSVIAIAPGAVQTDMLKQVLASGAKVKTFTDISEPTNFVIKFLKEEFNSKEISGRFLHVRDNLNKTDISLNDNLFKLRRIE